MTRRTDRMIKREAITTIVKASLRPYGWIELKRKTENLKRINKLFR